MAKDLIAAIQKAQVRHDEGVAHLDEQLDAAVRVAYEAGYRWTEIGAALGVSRQAASQKFARRLRLSKE